MTHSDLFKIFGVGLTLRLLWLAAFPVPFGEDDFGRIFFKDSLFLGHWLPLTQLLVYLVARLSDDIVWIRLAFAIIESLSACGFALFLRRIASESSALWGGLLFTVNALYVQLTLMPYQDIVFLGLLYASLGLLLKRRPEEGFSMDSRAASLFFGLSCLTRYESWFLLPFLALQKARLESVRKRYGLAEKVILFVGALEPRKNLPCLLRSYEKLLRAGEDTHQLVCVGGSGWGCDQVKAEIERLGLGGRVVSTGYVPYEHLSALYSLCRVFVFPSLHEGFGLPVMEAMACGAPVITAAGSSLSEIAGAESVDPSSEESISEALRRVTADEAPRESLSRRGLEHSGRFSWKNAARQTLEIYRRTAPAGSIQPGAGVGGRS